MEKNKSVETHIETPNIDVPDDVEKVLRQLKKSLMIGFSLTLSMTNFDKVLFDLLVHHNCVIIPEFGGFIAKRVSSQIDYEKESFHLLLSIYYSIDFSPQMTDYLFRLLFNLKEITML